MKYASPKGMAGFYTDFSQSVAPDNAKDPMSDILVDSSPLLRMKVIATKGQDVKRELTHKREDRQWEVDDLQKGFEPESFYTKVGLESKPQFKIGEDDRKYFSRYDSRVYGGRYVQEDRKEKDYKVNTILFENYLLQSRKVV